MKPNTLVTIEEKLRHRFTPSSLQIIDESDQHVGHPGRVEGKGHYRVIITCDELSALPRLQAHRLIYQCLQDEMSTRIHALAIQIMP